ncbi:MAG: two-component sensor histidine kinase [Myxococcales bacterium]|nr:two-component sensor histidine kinase [Myxococcales bacterium]
MASDVTSSALAAAEPGARRTGLYALLALIVGVAVALVVTSALAYRRAREVEGMLGRAQAEALLRSLAPSLRRGVDDGDLARLLDERKGDGLRYVGVIGPGGELIAEAGASLEPATLRPPPPGGPVAAGRRLGPRWRVYTPMPPRPPGGPLGPDGGPPGAGPPGGGRPVPAVIEVEVSVGPALRRDATRTLAVGLASALVLLGVAVVLARWVRHRERLEARIAHDRRLAALGQMSAVLAHEIRNPLASLKGHAQLLVESLQGSPAGARDRAKAERVVDEAVRLERLTNDLLEFARTGRIERAPCDPRAVLTAAAARAPERVTIVADAAPTTWSLDAGRMTQVLANLIGNALEAAPDAPVTATVAVDAGALVYRIRDRGPGLPGDVGRLLEPFHTTRVKGVGLGLTVAQRLVELHGGTLAGRTHPDGGAEFTATIPAGGR